MAKAIDYSKIERVQQAAMELIVEKGVGGASISMIARKANVADGYMYRFYKSKKDLVQDMLNKEVKELVNYIKQILNETKNKRIVIEKTIRHIFRIGRDNPTRVKFLYVLLHNYNLEVSKQQIESMSLLFNELTVSKTKDGKKSYLTKDQIFTMIIIYPIQYINYCFKGYFSKNTWNEVDEEKVIEFSLNALVNQNI